MLRNLDKVVRDMVKEGQPAEQVLKMPFYYVLQTLDEKHTNKVDSDAKADALLSAL